MPELRLLGGLAEVDEAHQSGIPHGLEDRLACHLQRFFVQADVLVIHQNCNVKGSNNSGC